LDKNRRSAPLRQSGQKAAEKPVIPRELQATEGPRATREHFHSHHLGEAISLYNPLTTERLDALTQTFTTQGIDPVTAHDRAIALLDLTVRKQAYLLAYGDSFHLMMILLIATVPLVFLCRRIKGGSAAGAH
jgi:MFS transporter, DHA2 family, multidrug resistance protein